MNEAEILRKLSLDQAERMAARHNARLAARYPLLASGNLISQTSAEQILAGFERWEGSRKKLLVRQERPAAGCRRLVTRRAGAGESAG